MNSVSSNPTSPRQSRKMCLSPSFSYSKVLDDKPSCRTRGMFSSNSSATFSFTKPDMIMGSTSKKHYPMRKTIDPILQIPSCPDSQSGKKIVPSTPSAYSVYSSQRKVTLPSELGIGHHSTNTYSSRIFHEFSDSYLFNGKKKAILSKKGEVPNLLTYSYALPYKDQGVTPKIGYSPR